MEENIETEEKRKEKSPRTKYAPLIRLAFTALFAALTAVGAFIRIPTPWLAFTLQLLFVFMAGLLLGPDQGVLRGAEGDQDGAAENFAEDGQDDSGHDQRK